MIKISVLEVCFFCWIIYKGFLFLLLSFMCHLKKKKEQGTVYQKDSDSENNTGDRKWLVNDIKRVFNGVVIYELKRIGRFPIRFVRQFLLKHVFKMEIGKKVIIYQWEEIRAPWNIKIQSGSIIGSAAVLDGRNGIIIGENCNLSSGVWIWTEQHDLNDRLFRCNDEGGPVVIDQRAWISSRTTVLPQIHIKEGAIVAAGAVITKNCESYTIYGGIPAKKIGIRSKELEYEFSGKGIPFI